MAGGRSGSLVAVAVVTFVVLAGALGGAYVLGRHPFAGHPTGAAAPATEAQPTLQCGGGPCQLLAVGTAGGDQVELFVGPDKGGRLRISGARRLSIFESQTSNMGVQLTSQSLTCVSGSVPACIVGGEYPAEGGVIGELYVDQNGDWERESGYVFADGGYLGLQEAVDSTGPSVVAVRLDCGSSDPGHCSSPKAYVEVSTVTRNPIGCSALVSITTPGAVPSSLDRHPRRSDLRPCPKSAP